MFLASIITLSALFFFLVKFGPNTIKKIVGMDKLADIAGTILLLFVFGATATISGMMTGLLAGLMLSIILIIAKGLMPHEKLERKRGKWQWTKHKGQWWKTKEQPASPQWWEVD